MAKGVFVYRNLARKYGPVNWSVRSNNSGLVIAHACYVMIRDATLVVSQAGRARVLSEKRKNVHAGIKGTWIRGEFNQHVHDWRHMDCVYDDKGNKLAWVRISYDPYRNEAFVRRDTFQSVNKADMVILSHDGAWALNPR
jgi:hypothetical protein